MTTDSSIPRQPPASPQEPAAPHSLAVSCIGLAGYIMFHSIPGTGALRSLFLLLMIGGLVHYTGSVRPVLRWPGFDLVGKTVVLLTVWLAFQSAFLAVDGEGSLKAFAVEWPKNLLLVAVGIWLARVAVFAKKGAWVILATFCGFFAHVLATLGYQVWQLIVHGQFALNMSLLGNYGYVSPYLDGVFAIVFADTASRLCANQPLLKIPARHLGLVFFLSALALLALSSKSSLVTAILMLALFAATIAGHGRRYRTQIMTITLATAVGLVALSGHMQGRWDGALESIRYGMAVDEHKHWMLTEHETPDESTRLPQNVNQSFYARAAWGTIGMRGLLEHPLGRGYGTNAFGRYLDDRYGIKGAVSSHSGWLDFAIGSGIPGLMLLLAVSVALCTRGWKAFVDGTGIGGLALMFLTFSYISRCMFDGLLSASKLMAFALVSGVLWGLSWNGDPVSESNSS